MDATMELKKVSTIDYDKKDSDLINCSNCGTSSFSVFLITHKETFETTNKEYESKHLHIRCIFCDLTYCTNVSVMKDTLKEIQAPSREG